ncbi:MAG: hypothetical protein WCO44_11610 [Bacteroidota bacterium]
MLLDFEGIGDFYPVGSYYSGAGGPNYGVTFSPGTVGVRDGIGTFTNEPSPVTVAVSLSASMLMNVAAGFNTSLSFYYAAYKTNWTVNIFDGPDGTGNLLATSSGAYNNAGTCGSYNVCVWTPLTINFAGTARSVVFS